MTVAFYRDYLALLDQIERQFPVSAWKGGDLEIWPLARMALYQDMYWTHARIAAPAERPLPLRIAGRIAMPLRNRWKTRDDSSHRVTRATPAYAIFLGDGISLDRVDGKWCDRFGEPLIAALATRGHDTFLMQDGSLSRLPWHRPTFAANVVESRGFLRALITRLPLELPGHEDVLDFVARNGARAPSLSRRSLERQANSVVRTADGFERVLEVVRPSIAFVVSYHARLAPAFLLACRRRRILSVDLQRAPHQSAPHAYRWMDLPRHGYATLPAVFWSWTPDDAAHIDEWASKLAVRCHSAIHGGHTQLSTFLDDQDPVTRMWDARFASVDAGVTFEREILVTLQPMHGYRAVWDALCAQIEASPASWRWWIRRHPAARPDQDAEAARLLALRRPNLNNVDASALPLPVLLRHMSAVLSLASGAAVEASMFGVPAFFLVDVARHAFADVIERRLATVIDVSAVNEELAKMAPGPGRPHQADQPDIARTLLQLEERAGVYRRTGIAIGGATPGVM